MDQNDHSHLNPAKGYSAINAEPRVRPDELAAFVENVFLRIGMDEASSKAVTRVMMHGSRLGVDSHGVRLLAHYIKEIDGNCINKQPKPKFTRTRPGAGVLDGDNGHGGFVATVAMDHAIALAREAGIGAVAIQRSNHFGAAGAYPMQAVEAGLIGLSTCNTDAFVHLHGSKLPFHGTNPFAIGAPVAGQRPWLLDFATSSIPVNRVMLYRSLGIGVPPDTAVDSEGKPTTDSQRATGLLPLGGTLFGFKGAGLGGLAEVLSAALTGMRASVDIPAWDSVGKPRELGQFVLAIDPEAFVPRAVYDGIMTGYLASLRGMEPAEGAEPPMAPGDREWRIEEERKLNGIPIDPATFRVFAEAGERFGLTPPKVLQGNA
ncbi:MAG: Ldh family oxidoreductase [Chelatococcus sp.]|jgi:ureidoglycolate dehydrogenase (NAD+)|uniref:Ldh family oxidoreductase n=1 Tax=Chelatococcus sp. TaxID=1953771 RepID=UPI0025C13A23|nr:Ldh family oxidoreductase [Chelatococcus sp.]MBX3538868.1 Ldh family oxidoreductase [Chelatococcus sp.]